MKSLILATAIILPLGAGTAAAETGEMFDWSNTAGQPAQVTHADSMAAVCQTASLTTRNNLADNQSPMFDIYNGNG